MTSEAERKKYIAMFYYLCLSKTRYEKSPWVWLITKWKIRIAIEMSLTLSDFFVLVAAMTLTACLSLSSQYALQHWGQTVGGWQPQVTCTHRTCARSPTLPATRPPLDSWRKEVTVCLSKGERLSKILLLIKASGRQICIAVFLPLLREKNEWNFPFMVSFYLRKVSFLF